MVALSFKYRVGDLVIFRITKYSTEPARKACSVFPSEHGDTYHYGVDKFWVVRGVTATNELVLVTRRGKTHTVAQNDPRLRRPTWWERLVLRDRFPKNELVFAELPGNRPLVPKQR